MLARVHAVIIDGEKCIAERLRAAVARFSVAWSFPTMSVKLPGLRSRSSLRSELSLCGGLHGLRLARWRQRKE